MFWDGYLTEEGKFIFSVVICLLFCLGVPALISSCENNRTVVVEVPAMYYSCEKTGGTEAPVWDKHFNDYVIETTPGLCQLTLLVYDLPWKQMKGMKREWAVNLTGRKIRMEITQYEFDEIREHNTLRGQDLHQPLRLRGTWYHKDKELKDIEIIYR